MYAFLKIFQKPFRLFWRVREMGFTFSFSAFRQVDSYLGPNEAFRFDTSAVERGPRSNFWDHSALFRSTGFAVIDPNRPFFRENRYICYILGMIFWLCNAPIWKLKEILISSLLHFKEIYIIFQNSTRKSFPIFLCSLQAARFLPYVFLQFSGKNIY